MKTNVVDLPYEVQEMLHEFSDIVVDDIPNEVPLKRSIIHHIDFISRESLPNKATYGMKPKENEEIRKQV